MYSSLNGEKYRRQEDACILALAEEIKSDKKRYESAKLGAREILDETFNRTDGLRKVIGSKSFSKKSSPRINTNNQRSTSNSDVIPDIFKR